MSEQKQTVPIVYAIMRINTDTQTIDIQQIKNRRFMYDPESGILILGRQYGKTTGLPSSHAEELADAGITSGFDNFVRGWVGTGRGYPNGVVHFAPAVDGENISRYERAFDTLEMFSKNGAVAGTLIRGFGNRWEQPLSMILNPQQSVRKQLKCPPEHGPGRHTKTQHHER